MATTQMPLEIGAGQFLSSAFPQLVRNGTNFPVLGLAYDAAAVESAYWYLHASLYGSGNVTVNLHWYADTASSGDVVWGVQLAAITPNTDTQDVETKALATANTVTDSHLGTTGQRLHECDVTVSNVDSLANNDALWVRIYRDATNGSDTMTGDAILTSIVASYSDT